MTRIKSFYNNNALVADAAITAIIMLFFAPLGLIALALNLVLGAAFIYLYYWLQVNQSSILERLNLGNGIFRIIVSGLGVYFAVYLLLLVVSFFVPALNLVVFPMAIAMLVSIIGGWIRRVR